MKREEFVTLEIGKLLYQLGFDDKDCFYWHEFKSAICINDYVENDKSQILLPLWQQAEEYLRKKFDIFITYGDNGGFGKPGFCYMISVLQSNGVLFRKGNPLKQNDPLFPTYEDARESAILESIKIIRKWN